MKGLYIDMAWYGMIWHVQDEVSGFGMWEPIFWPCVLMFLSGPARGSSRFSRGRDLKPRGLPWSICWRNQQLSDLGVTPREMENESQRLRKNNLLDQSVFTNIMRYAGNWNRFNWGGPTTNSIQLCESPPNIIQGKSWYIHNSGNIMASTLNHLWVIGWPSVALATEASSIPEKIDVFLSLCHPGWEKEGNNENWFVSTNHP